MNSITKTLIYPDDYCICVRLSHILLNPIILVNTDRARNSVDRSHTRFPLTQPLQDPWSDWADSRTHYLNKRGCPKKYRSRKQTRASSCQFRPQTTNKQYLYAIYSEYADRTLGGEWGWLIRSNEVEVLERNINNIDRASCGLRLCRMRVMSSLVIINGSRQSLCRAYKLKKHGASLLGNNFGGGACDYAVWMKRKQ